MTKQVVNAYTESLGVIPTLFCASVWTTPRTTLPRSVSSKERIANPPAVYLKKCQRWSRSIIRNVQNGEFRI
jgi:hypothetical protein